MHTSFVQSLQKIRYFSFLVPNGLVKPRVLEAGRTTNLQIPHDMLNKPISALAIMVVTITAAPHHGTGPS